MYRTRTCPYCGLDACCGDCGGVTPEKEAVFPCDGCTETLSYGDKYLAVCHQNFCEECVNSWSKAELLEVLGHELQEVTIL